MDPAREVELIHTIDSEIRRLLEHADQLAGAGDKRPVLVAVGVRLRAALEPAAALAGSLAALLSDAAEKPARKRSIAPLAAKPILTPISGVPGPSGPAVRVQRLPPYRPRFRVRRAKTAVPAEPIAALTAEVEPFRPLHVLRKAGAKQEDAVAPVVTEREQLRRLGEFFEARAEVGEEAAADT